MRSGVKVGRCLAARTLPEDGGAPGLVGELGDAAPRGTDLQTRWEAEGARCCSDSGTNRIPCKSLASQAGVPLDDKLPAPAGHWAVWYLTPSGEMLQVTDHAPVWGCREGA